MNEPVKVTNQEIIIQANLFVHKDYSITRRELLLDIFSKYYTGQQIRIYVFDGENLEFSGFTDAIADLCVRFSINPAQVSFESHNHNFDTRFAHKQLLLGIFISVKNYLPKYYNQDRSQARFVGALLGRFNPIRFRLAYELDCAFPNNNYTVFQPRTAEVEKYYRDVAHLYQVELEWIRNKQFDQDIASPHPSGMVDWPAACEQYTKLWNQFDIEVVSETDALSDFWFTEKTARCLVTGKPFVLVAGQGSLQRIQDMGFKTFNSVIDESYDLCTNPGMRIKHLISSLQELYNSSNRSEQINQLYQIASQNSKIYLEYIKDLKEQ